MSEREDRAAIAAIIREIYAMLSGPAGPRAYDSVKHRYHPDARLVRTGLDASGAPFASVMSVEAHHAEVDIKFAAMAFLEEEIAHDCEVFGNIARVRSCYRSVYGEGASAVEGRGVNFFTLIRSEGRWLIISCVWDTERPGLRLALA